jgi:hypothetical protein
MADSIGHWINQHSLALLMAGILAVVLIACLRRGWRRRDYFLVGGLALGMLVIGLLFRPAASPGADLSAIQNQIAAGQPVLLEFQSPY